MNLQINITMAMVNFTLSICESFLPPADSKGDNPFSGKIFHSITEKFVGSFQLHFNYSQQIPSEKLSQPEKSLIKKRPIAQPRGASKAKTTRIENNATPSTQIFNSFGSMAMEKPNVESLIIPTQNLQSGEKIFQCSICTVYCSKNKAHVKRHIEIKHLPSSTVFKCRMCDVTCSLRYNLKNHYMSKHNMPDDAAKAML